MHPKSIKILSIPPKIGPKSVKSSSTFDFGWFWAVFGAKTRPGRRLDANTHPSYSILGAFLARNGGPRVDFETLEKSEIAPKPDF